LHRLGVLFTLAYYLHRLETTMTDYKFEGWMGLDAESAKGNMVWREYEPKSWEETDIDIKITNSGICGSDLHTLRSGWVGKWPLCE
jgi:hypothetical protein